MKSRIKINIRGTVQGVGFRPFIFRLAKSLNLNGYVYNNSIGVFIEAEGEKEQLDNFILRIETEKPELSIITGLEFSFLDPVGFTEFEITGSNHEESKSALILPDIAMCDDCTFELNDPSDRRYKYPFINCTNCGPRFSIIESIPYDRPNTSMKDFLMCEECKQEYKDPLNRRFHAQPIACPKCGPHIEIRNSNGTKVESEQGAIDFATEIIREGKILALKGLGGYQLIVDARNEIAINNLRSRKFRDEKPFALMLPTIEMIIEICYVTEFEQRLLKSPESPIVLLKKREIQSSYISDEVAPGNPYLGIMLPYTPLHYLLLDKLQIPIVATSGNISEEPICIDDDTAFQKLGDIADYFLIHNRPIVRQVDDSLVRIVLNKELVLRRARGYAPIPIQSESENRKTTLAVGGHLKNNISLNIGDQTFVSQYIGDLSSDTAYSSFVNVIKDFEKLYNTKPSEIVSDMHPEYLSTKYAQSLPFHHKSVQHHLAHVASCKLENQINGSVLGVSFDGTGYGLDATIWGGEFFLVNDNSFSHVAQFMQFPLPGGELAIKESRRSAIGLLYEIFGDELFNDESLIAEMKYKASEIEIIKRMLDRKINSPFTSSVGRLFDAVSSILNISHISNYEGQSAMKLEFAASENEQRYYPIEIIENELFVIDWQNLIKEIISDVHSGIDTSIISAKFHNSISDSVLQIAEIIGEEKIVLSGGCFQNLYLTEGTVHLLSENGFKVFTHQRIPPNDGGISLGQIAAADLEFSKFQIARYNSTYNVL